MTYTAFKNLLSAHQGMELNFEYAPGLYVRSDFHMTEIKNVTFDTVDCGGLQNEWNEVHIQLWEPELYDPAHKLDSTKALKILETVEKVRLSFPDAELKFEYGNKTYPTVILPISSVEVNGEILSFTLGESQTTCKAADRQLAAGEEVTACCSPSQESNGMKVDLGNLVLSKNNCC